MKNFHFIYFLLLLIACEKDDFQAFNNIIINSQSDIDKLTRKFNKPRIIEGNVHIIIEKDKDLNDLSFFDEVEIIEGRLIIEGTGIKDLNSFNSLTEVGGLSIINNPTLEKAELPKLKRIEFLDEWWSIFISGNSKLQHISLPFLQELYAGISIVYNPELSSIYISNDIERIDRIYLNNNKNLVHLDGLGNYKYSTSVIIYFNKIPTHLPTLEKLTSSSLFILFEFKSGLGSYKWNVRPKSSLNLGSIEGYDRYCQFAKEFCNESGYNFTYNNLVLNEYYGCQKLIELCE